MCDDCAGTLDEGYLFDYVSTEDMQDLTTIDGIEIGACIRFKLDGSDFDLDNVAVVDDCCCETLGYWVTRIVLYYPEHFPKNPAGKCRVIQRLVIAIYLLFYRHLENIVLNDV